MMRAPAQRGATMLVVLVVLTVMLLGGMALARITETSTQASGNASFRDASLQASQVGVNTAFQNLQALADPEASSGGWYWSTLQPVDAAGLPNVAWAGVPATNVGAYEVRWVVERLCNATPVTSRMDQCLVSQVPQVGSQDPTMPKIDPPTAIQYRLTVRVLGPKGTQTWVQALANRP